MKGFDERKEGFYLFNEEPDEEYDEEFDNEEMGRLETEAFAEDAFEEESLDPGLDPGAVVPGNVDPFAEYIRLRKPAKTPY